MKKLRSQHGPHEAAPADGLERVSVRATQGGTRKSVRHARSVPTLAFLHTINITNLMSKVDETALPVVFLGLHQIKSNALRRRLTMCFFH